MNGRALGFLPAFRPKRCSARLSIFGGIGSKRLGKLQSPGPSFWPCPEARRLPLDDEAAHCCEIVGPTGSPTSLPGGPSLARADIGPPLVLRGARVRAGWASGPPPPPVEPNRAGPGPSFAPPGFRGPSMKPPQLGGHAPGPTMRNCGARLGPSTRPWLAPRNCARASPDPRSPAVRPSRNFLPEALASVRRLRRASPEIRAPRACSFETGP